VLELLSQAETREHLDEREEPQHHQKQYTRVTTQDIYRQNCNLKLLYLSSLAVDHLSPTIASSFVLIQQPPTPSKLMIMDGVHSPPPKPADHPTSQSWVPPPSSLDSQGVITKLSIHQLNGLLFNRSTWNGAACDKPTSE
jgi:hypothetical protein